MSLSGLTPKQAALIAAVKRNDLNQVEILSQGIDLNFSEPNGSSPLEEAIVNGKPELMMVLLERGARLDYKSENGTTGLYRLASWDQNKEMVKRAEPFLADPSVNINVLSKSGNTALHDAFERDNIELVKILLANGADVHLKNSDGRTVFELAEERSRESGANLAFTNLITHPASSSTTQFSRNLSNSAHDLEPLFQTYSQDHRSELTSDYSNASLSDELDPEAFDSLFELTAASQDDELEPMVRVNSPAQDPELLFRVNNPSAPEHLFTQRTGQAPAPGNDVDVLFEQNTFNPSLNARRVPRTPVRHFDEAQLTPEQMNNYQTIFADNPYLALTKVIKHQNEVPSATLEGKTVNFQRRLASIVPALQFAVKGAREEYRQADLNGQPKAEIAARLATFEHIQDMFLSLEALTKNKSRYTQEHFDHRVAQLQTQLKNQNIDPDIREALDDALKDVIEQNIFNKRKFYQSDKAGMGSTPFDATKESLSLGDIKKRVKIEHTNDGKDVTAIFSYSRNKLLGNKSKKLWTSRKEEYKNFRAQIQDMVNVGVSEYNKGSVDNPINLRYVGPPQPEAAIMLLMEYKKRAILEGKTFHAKNHEGKVIEITPSENFTAEERAYFMHFATQKPQFADGNDLKAINQSAGYKIFKMGVEMEKPMDDAKISDGMDRYLLSMLGKSRTKLDAKMDNIGSQLGQVAATNTWQDNSATKRAQFRT